MTAGTGTRCFRIGLLMPGSTQTGLRPSGGPTAHARAALALGASWSSTCDARFFDADAMTEFISVIRRKTCAHCAGEIPRGTSNRKYCCVACDKAALRAQGPARFWAKVDKAGPGGCWLYMGFRKWDGYGWVSRSAGDRKYRWLTAHRYAWILTHGEPADGLHIMHTCDVPACCNPSHLRLGTHLENMADMRAKGRSNNSTKKSLHPDRVRPRRVSIA